MISRTWPLVLAFALSMVAIAIALQANTVLLDQAGSLTRWTARFGLPLFLLSFAASSLRYFVKNDATKYLLQQRRYWGLGFAWMHSVHLIGFVLVITNDDITDTFADLAPGGAIYILMYLMAITSNNWSVRRLGRYWRWLHLAGAYALWAGFTVAYTSRSFGFSIGADGNVFDLLAAALLYCVLILRFAAWRGRRT